MLLVQITTMDAARHGFLFLFFFNLYVTHKHNYNVFFLKITSFFSLKIIVSMSFIHMCMHSVNTLHI